MKNIMLVLCLESRSILSGSRQVVKNKVYGIDKDTLFFDTDGDVYAMLCEDNGKEIGMIMLKGFKSF